MTKTQKTIAMVVVAILALGGTALAASYFTREAMAPEPKPQQAKAVRHAPPRGQMAAAQPVQQRPACDDHNIVGTVGGAVAGGLVGSAFGKGNGRGLATAGGAVAGGALGNAYVPTRGVTCD